MDVFGGAPRFLAYPRPVVVQSGTDAVLKCQISGDPRPAVIWERNNETIQPGGKYRVFEDGNVYNLIITLVTAEDGGQYTCKAKNSIGETYAAATLKVEGEAQEMELREENKPRFLIKPLSTRVGRGEDAVFSCKLWGKPRPEVVWEKDGKKLNEIFESTHFSVGYQDGGWFQLKIFKTRAPDGGVYTCKARNEFGESLAGAVLLVDAGPGHEEEGNRNGYTNGHRKTSQGKQRSSRHVVTRLKEDPLLTSAKVKMFAVTEGKHAKFRCYVTGKPKPEIIWRKDGRIILSGRRYLLYEDREGYFTLKVLYCKQQDNGVYVCAASNTAGQTLSAVHLSVKEPPVKFKQPLNDLEVWEQEQAILECEVPEDSVCITWYLEDRRLQPGAKYGMEEWGTKRRLTIRDMGVDDDGIYLCEMPDGGRSIAEVTVKGTIVRKLPRKVDVLEGENAAFCVEVEEEEMDIHWYKDGIELRETHQTIIKSFGRTHILVFVNTTPQDSGLVVFYVGRSKTSSQLRVKAVRQCPPSCPVGVQINTERANAALLSWVPAQDCRKNPPSGYILERQEIGFQEWLQCLTTDSATSVEILGDSVPCEADYRFRICSINKYGRSGYVEFPRAVHLVPVAKIQTPLQDALVPEGQDACFSIELSASVIGTWFWNGTQIQDDERFLIRRSRTHQSLQIRGVRDTDNGAEITFIAYGIRDSAALYLQAPLVKFTPLSEMDRNKFVEAGNPIVLYCELSNSDAPVRWYKNGVELHSIEGLHIQAEGTMRRIVIQSAEFSHSGVYSCDAIDDVIRFNVEVEDFQSNGTKRALVVEKADFPHTGVYSCKTKGAAVQFNVEIKAPSVRFSVGSETERRKTFEAGGTIILQCEISDSSGQVCWFKDGKQILMKSGVDFQSEGCLRRLIVKSAELSHSGVYRCTTKDDLIEFQVEIKAVPVRFLPVAEVEKNKCIEAGNSFELRCKVTDPTADVYWYKDETEILNGTGWEIQTEGIQRMLVVQSAELSHSGLYSCNMPDDSVQFSVDIKAPLVKFSAFPGVVKNQLFEADYPTELHCEISDPPAKVCWYEDGVELISKSQPHIKMEDSRRKLAVKAAQSSESGWQNSQRKDKVIQFNVQDEASPLKLPDVPDVEKSDYAVESISAAQQYETWDSTKYTHQLNEENEILAQNEIEPEPQIGWEVPKRTLNIKSSKTTDNGIKRPRMPDDHAQFNPDKAEQSHSESETFDDTVQCSVDMKAESFPEIAKSNIMESLCVTDGSDFAKSEITKESLAFPQEAPIPVLTKNIVNMESLRFTDSPKLTTSEILEESLRFNTLHDLADAESTKQSSSFTECSKVSKSNSLQERLSFIEHIELSENKNLKESLRYTAVPDFAKSKNTEKSWSFTADPVLATMDNTKESLKSQKENLIAGPEMAKTNKTKTSLSFTDCSEDSQSKSLKESLSFIADPDLAITENTNESLSFIADPDLAITENTNESLSFIAYPDLDITKNTNESLSFITDPDLAITENTKESLRSPTKSFIAGPEVAKTNKTKTSLSFTDCSEVSQSKSLKESLSFIADPDLAITENTNESLSFIADPDLAITENTNESLSFIADPDLAITENTNESLSFIADPDLAITENTKESLSFIADPDLAITENTNESLSFIADPDLAITENTNESLSFRADPDLAFTENTNESLRSLTESVLADPEMAKTNKTKTSLRFTDCFDFGKSEIKRKSLSLTTHSKVDKNKNSKERLSVTNCPEFMIQKSLSFTAFSELPIKEKIKDIIPKQSQDTKMDSTAYKNEDLPKHQCIKQEAACSFKEDDRSYSNVQAICTDDKVLACKVDYKAAQDMSDEKALEAACPTNPDKFSEKKAQIFGHGDILKVQQQDGKHVMSKLASRKQFAQTPHKEVLISEAEDECVICQDQVKVKFTPLPETGKTKTIESGTPLVLQCEISSPDAPVCWFKDGIQLQTKYGLVIQSKNCIRRLVVPSAELRHTGVYSCEAMDDVIKFKVYVEAAQLNSSTLTETEKNETTFNGEDNASVLEKEAIDTTSQCCWYRQEHQQIQECLSASSRTSLMQLEDIRSEEIKSTDCSDSGVYSYETKDNNILNSVDSPVPPVMFSNVSEAQTNISAVLGEPFELECEVSDAAASVSWYKEGKKLSSEDGVLLQSEGTMRKLFVKSAELSHSGTYTCKTYADAVTFNVDIEATSTSKPLSEMETNRPLELDSPNDSEYEFFDSKSQVLLNKDDKQPLSKSESNIPSDDNVKKSTVQSTERSDTRQFISDSPDDIVSKMDSQATLIRFLALPEVERNKYIEAGCPIILQCEISESAAQVSWFKDGMPLLQESGLDIKSEGTMRKMIIQSAELKHSGMYSCKAKDDHIAFRVDVAASHPVTFTPISETEKTKSFEAGSPIILQREISEPTALVQWYKDGTPLFPQSGIFFQSENTVRMLVILSATYSHSGVYTCNTADDFSEFYVDIKAPPVTFAYIPEEQLHKNVVEQDDLMLCCEVSRSSATTRWYKDGVEIQTSNKVTIATEHTKQTLIIQSVQMSDAGIYTCRAGGSALVFKVNVREPPVMIVYPKEDVHLDRHVPEEIVLSCELSRPNGKVTWLKDGQKLQESKNMKLKIEGPYRRLKILHSRVEDSGEYVCDTADDSKFFYLSIKEPPVRIVSPSQSQMELCQQTSERMVLSCEISRVNASVRWYRNGLEVEQNSNLILEVDGVYRRLIIPETTVSDSAEYVCDTVDDSVTFFVNIAEPPVRFIRPRKMAYKVERFVGDTIVLDCEVSRSNAEVIWKKNGEEIEENSNITITEDGSARQLTIHSSRAEDTGQYLCDAKDDVMDFSLKINEPPLKFLQKYDVITDRFFVVSDAIVLKCELSRTNGVVCWYKDNNRILAKDHFTFEEQGAFRSLIILNAEIGDTGEYMCTAKDDKIVFNVTVQEPPFKFTKKEEINIAAYEEESVTLCAAINRDNGSVQWTKGGKTISDPRFFATSDGHTHYLTIKQLKKSDAGEYECDVGTDKAHFSVQVKAPRVVEFIAELHNITVMEGEDARFKCVVSPEDAKMVWCMNDQLITSNERFQISSNGLCHMLFIKNCQVSDSCKLTAEAEGVISKATLRVEEKQVLFTKNLEPVVAEEFGEATLEAELSLECREVQWMRQGVVIQPGPKFTLKQSGRKCTLTIHKLALSDRGTYSCETLHDRTQACLSVEPRKVKVRKGLSEIQTFERETASFEVELTHSNVEGTWLKDGNRLKSNNRCRMTSKDCVHSLTISNLSLEDTGTYTFSTENTRSSARLTVKETPVSILKKLENSTYPEGTGVTMECELSKYNVTVKWTKDGEELKPGKSHRIYSMGRKCFLQIVKCQTGDAGVYVCDAGDATTSCSLEVYERDLEVLQGLEDLDIQEDQNAVFMCEVSLDDAPGEWFRNGEKIKPTSTIRIRQEGTKHFLLMCNVKSEDSGEIKFLAKNVESIAYLEVEKLPVNIVKPLQDTTALENTRVLLDCTVSNPRCSIRWYKGRNVILPSERFEICSEGCYRKLVIQEVAMQDAGMYSVQVGENTSSARLTVEAQVISMVQELQDVEVSAPEEACFVCEVNVPLLKSPIWTLNGEVLKSGPKVLMEKMGTVHKLTLKHTSEDMSGVVVFDSGKAKSAANLHVKKSRYTVPHRITTWRVLLRDGINVGAVLEKATAASADTMKHEKLERSQNTNVS
ncbi:Obscurin [Bagarius yarrelli]|uniref:Obscurin-like protein 1 n=1 Tax=Bagarius yarrelli TaxID=175774 RepID=A0A556U011_BAGYA|nr:Obscurin [Bagarius yarrelli]